MKCINTDCGNDRHFRTVRTVRDQKFDYEKNHWVYSDAHDSRLVLCLHCNRVFWTLTERGREYVSRRDRQIVSSRDQTELF
jgi:hypothetical protein